MYSIKRYALYLAPKKRLIEWQNYIFPEATKVEPTPPLTHDGGEIYLVPQFDCTEDAMEWLSSNFEYFFEQQLFGWCTDENLWPKDRTWEMFQEWVYISFQSCVYDVLDEPIEKEEF